MPNSKLEADPQKEFCSNPNYGKRGVGNIVRYGHDRNGRQRFNCKTCDGVFVETKNTVFYNQSQVIRGSDNHDLQIAGRE